MIICDCLLVKLSEKYETRSLINYCWELDRIRWGPYHKISQGYFAHKITTHNCHGLVLCVSVNFSSHYSQYIFKIVTVLLSTRFQVINTGAVRRGPSEQNVTYFCKKCNGGKRPNVDIKGALGMGRIPDPPSMLFLTHSFTRVILWLIIVQHKIKYKI